MFKHPLACLLFVCLAATITLADAPTPAPTVKTFEGTLKTGIMAIGGETTGTVLKMKDGSQIDLDLGKDVVLSKLADALNGKPVIVTGELTTIPGTEIKERQVLTVQTLKEPNIIPQEVLKVLNSPQNGILYSLEPLEQPQAGDDILYKYKVLGKMSLITKQSRIAANAVRDAVKNYVGYAPMCFDPRHNLRILSEGHTYDFLLCYSCNALDIYIDGKVIISLGASGSPKILNDLLAAGNVPLSREYTEKK